VTFDCGDVVVVPFPFVDISVRRKRPALVLSSSDFNRTHAQAVCAMITTASRSAWPTDYRIVDEVSAGLYRSSVVRLKLFTIESQLIVRKIGRLAGDDWAAASTVLRQALGLR
jgi:mRNA interferase MazF